ncbi:MULTISPECIES: PstS family phosphate ABC transporter substrate-binding protein [unclassified Synechocystis]|uniref:PstS family phosphate ABC transporter substrate-binding protein n=1 Tax=unclassified Synechocystis TaxID=2640012 RepID=UPI000423A322|nr:MULTISPECIES: PstS family phosphate ABC transporter substrate-binding protein [unclassified Synechocystis]AIE74186.1 Phosphate-binding protein [Synechocystis sp. PCC 6714]MCT0252819.1 PstS family phosphate ABC transporter substrate-binding protein [Synechocystis sp. CS-94]
MGQKNEAVILIGALAITGALLAGGGWWLWQRFQTGGENPGQMVSEPGQLPPPPELQVSDAFVAPTQVPAGTKISIDGSTSMVNINETLKAQFQQTFPGTVVQTDAQGTDRGVVNLILGKVDLSASSRPLTSQEQNQGLAAVPVANDTIAVMVGVQNPFTGGLTSAQLRDIFTGKITNWSEVGGPNGAIQVINRPSESGTQQTFAAQVLQGQAFGQGTNFQTMPRDATTPIIRALGSQGVSYATYVQLQNQQTVRVVPIDGFSPNEVDYPLRRQLFYFYKTPPSPAVEAFLGFATSPQGQQAIANVGQ